MRRLPDIPRSTRTGRGELAGAAPSPRQSRRVTVHIEQVAPGVMQLSTPFGWRSPLARNPVELARLVASAFVETQVHAYSTWRQREYDLATEKPDKPKPRRPARHGHRVDVHDPRDWKVAEDGRWIDPGSGRRWKPESQMVQQIMKRRDALGLSPIPDQVSPGQGPGLLNGQTG